MIARLGFERREDTDLYDEDAGDFRHEAVVRGQAVTFVRLADLAVAYERRRGGMPGEIFMGGLRCMPQAADRRPEWTVADLDGRTGFDQWARSVDSVHRFRFRVEGHRLPRQPQSPILDALIRAGSEMVTIDLRSKTGVDVEGATVRELVRVADGGLGDVLAVGRRNGTGIDGTKKAWVSVNKAERVVHELSVDPESEGMREGDPLRVLATVPVDRTW